VELGIECVVGLGVELFGVVLVVNLRCFAAALGALKYEGAPTSEGALSVVALVFSSSY